MTDLSDSALYVLQWLAESEFGQYGECKGKALDELVAAGLAVVHPAGQHQSGFIAQDPAGTRGDDYRAVSVTTDGRAYLKALKETGWQPTYFRPSP